LQDQDGRSALLLSSMSLANDSTCRNAYSVERLLSLGASVALADLSGTTVLHWLAAAGLDHLCQLALAAAERQSVPDLADRADAHQTTPLMCGAKMGRIQVMRLLIERRVMLDQVDDEGRTALTLAASAGHTDVVQLLLEAGMDEMHKGMQFDGRDLCFKQSRGDYIFLRQPRLDSAAPCSLRGPRDRLQGAVRDQQAPGERDGPIWSPRTLFGVRGGSFGLPGNVPGRPRAGKLAVVRSEWIPLFCDGGDKRSLGGLPKTGGSNRDLYSWHD